MRKALHILGILLDTDIDWIVANSQQQSVAAGQVLIQQNVAIDHLYIVLDGKFEVRIGTLEKTPVATLFAGEIVGEISFVDHRLPTASVIAIARSAVLALPRSSLTAKLEVDRAFAARFYLAIASFLADRLYTSTGRLGFGSATEDNLSDALNEEQMGEIGMGSLRFDKLLRSVANASKSDDQVASSGSAR